MATEFTRLVEDGAKFSLDIENQAESGSSSTTNRVLLRKTCCGDWLKSLSFGGFDGVMASLVIIFGSVGCNVSYNGTLLLGFAFLGGTSIYVTLSEFMSAKAHRDFLMTEKRRAVWEFKHFKEQEMKVMESRFIAKGMSRKDAESVVLKLSAYENVFVGLMASEELGQQLPQYNEESSVLFVSDAILIGISYALFGSFSLLAKFGFGHAFSESTVLKATFGVGTTMLIILNLIKSSFGSGKWMYSIVEAVLLSALCSGAAYYAGLLLYRVSGGN